MGTGTNSWYMDVLLCCRVVVYVLVCARSVDEEGDEGKNGEMDERETRKSAGRMQGRIRRGNSLQGGHRCGTAQVRLSCSSPAGAGLTNGTAHMSMLLTRNLVSSCL